MIQLSSSDNMTSYSTTHYKVCTVCVISLDWPPSLLTHTEAIQISYNSNKVKHFQIACPPPAYSIESTASVKYPFHFIVAEIQLCLLLQVKLCSFHIAVVTDQLRNNQICVAM